jgi:hypothetical protein
MLILLTLLSLKDKKPVGDSIEIVVKLLSKVGNQQKRLLVTVQRSSVSLVSYDYVHLLSKHESPLHIRTECEIAL